MPKKITKKEVEKIKREPTALVLEEPKALSTPASLIEMGIAKGTDLEKLEKLLALQERWEANEARKAYARSMVIVHQNMPTIEKTLENKQTHSMYAALDRIICKTKDIYTGQGFSISFYEGVTEKPEHIRICSDVIHSLGHKETYFYDVPMDGKGIKGNANMTPIHGKSSSASYGRRQLMCMIWNIPTGDDVDGNQPEPEKTKVSMPTTSQNQQKEVSKEAKTEEAVIVEPDKTEKPVTEQSGLISKETAQSLANLAKMNGYSYKETCEIIAHLGYAKVIDVLQQDYATILDELTVKAVDWRGKKEEIKKEAVSTDEINWDE